MKYPKHSVINLVEEIRQFIKQLDFWIGITFCQRTFLKEYVTKFTAKKTDFD